MSSLELLTCMLLVSISAYMSGSEIALFSLSRFQLRSLKERFRSAHRKIKRLLSDPGGLLVTILIVNEIVNISLSTIITTVISRTRTSTPHSLMGAPSWAIDTLLGLLVTAPVVLFLCEITPKVIGAKINQLVATMTVGPMTLIYDGFVPVRKFLTQIVAKVARWTGRPLPAPKDDKKKDEEAILKESDFMLMVEEGHREGAIHEDELELIKNVFELDDTTVSDVFTPLLQVQTISVNSSLRGALTSLRSQKHSRIPITSSNQKEVLGVLYSKDLLKAKLDPSLLEKPVSEIMRKPFFVNPSMRLNAIFRKFKQANTHMAIVQSSGGDALGVVTMTDVLDALFEDIFPEEDIDDDFDEELDLAQRETR